MKCVFHYKTKGASDDIDTGKLGEDIASAYLKDRGFKVIDRNVQVGDYELDIIAVHNKTLCCIEVKAASVSRETISSGDYVRPSEHITDQKLSHIKKGFIRYCGMQGTSYGAIKTRFDVVLLLIDRKQMLAHIRHDIGVSGF